MSNVIKMDISYVGTDQPGIVGKVWEQFYTDAAGNQTSRLYRLIKATSAIDIGDICHVAAANVNNMRTLGSAGPLAAAANEALKVAGVGVTQIPSGSYGFVVCRGNVDTLAVAAAYGGAIGGLLQTSGVIRQTLAWATGAGKSSTIVGTGLSAIVDHGAGADPRYTISAYINVL